MKDVTTERIVNILLVFLIASISILVFLIIAFTDIMVGTVLRSIVLFGLLFLAVELYVVISLEMVFIYDEKIKNTYQVHKRKIYIITGFITILIIAYVGMSFFEMNYIILGQTLIPTVIMAVSYWIISVVRSSENEDKKKSEKSMKDNLIQLD